ncbi:MAG: transaldolase, partial [Planctomycetes bacterium]|nr:transaldolase [Planctomycetota bacterium]
MIASGELARLVDDGIVGLTSNPTLFDKAIRGSNDYDDALANLIAAGKSDAEVYEALVIEDIRAAADILLPVYERTDRADGYVSLEVNPNLAHDTTATV